MAQSIDLYKGDCLDVMKNLPDRSVDCVISDLPYFGVVGDDFDNQWHSRDEYLDWVRAVVSEYARVLKDDSNIFLFTSRQYNRFVCDILEDNGFEERRIIIWCRKRNFNTTRGKALASGYEPICYFSRGQGIFNNLKIKPDTKRKEYTDGLLKDGVSLSDVWTDIPALPHNSKEKLPHPTQKPLALMERIVSLGTNEGDVILDSCMGTGTTGAACLSLGRSFIGIEQNEAFFAVARERLKDVSEKKVHEV